MGQKSKKHKQLKLNDEQLCWVIDVVLREQIMMLAVKHKPLAIELADSCLNILHNLKNRKEFKHEESVEQFIKEASGQLSNFYNVWISAQLKDILLNGVPKTLNLVTPQGNRLVN